MLDFNVMIRLDTPVLQGGAADSLRNRRRTLDPLYAVRPAALRGLMHTFTRALFAPLLGDEQEKLLRAERFLLGAQGGMKYEVGTDEHEFGSTFALKITHADPEETEKVEIRPGNPRMEEAYNVSHPALTISVIPRAWKVAEDRDLPAMLWTVLWCGLSFGGVGLRSRRGYGSLTPIRITPEPKCSLLDEANESTHACFPEPPKRDQLASSLTKGFSLAQERARAWLGERHKHHFEPLLKPVLGDSFFQMAGAGYVNVGKPYESMRDRAGRPHSGWYWAQKALMDECSDQKHRNRSYANTLGGIRPGAPASTLWVRLYRVDDGGREAWVPVATVGAKRLVSRTQWEPITVEILKAIGCASSSPPGP